MFVLQKWAATISCLQEKSVRPTSQCKAAPGVLMAESAASPPPRASLTTLPSSAFPPPQSCCVLCSVNGSDRLCVGQRGGQGPERVPQPVYSSRLPAVRVPVLSNPSFGHQLCDLEQVRPHCLSTEWGSERTISQGCAEVGGESGDYLRHVSPHACPPLRLWSPLTRAPTQCLETGSAFHSPHSTAEETEAH